MPGFSLLLDAGRDLADMRVGNGQHHDFGAVERLFDGDSIDAETVLEALTPRLADLDMTDLVRRAAEVRGQAIAHFSASAEQGDFRHV